MQTIQDQEQAGWVVLDPLGKVLRRFVDSNGDKIVDQWRYFQDGIEVYRDIDADFDRKADQYRWLNTAGSRWGVDVDEDGAIDHWKSISAQEVTLEIVAALAGRDPDRFERLLLTGEELQGLQLGAEQSQALAAKLAKAKANFRQLLAENPPLTSQTSWAHFSASQPGVVPAGTAGSRRDLRVYENVVAMVETSGKSGLVQIGTLVQVGDVWRAIDAPAIPAPGATATALGFFFNRERDEVAAEAARPDVVSEEMQSLLSQLEKLQQQTPPSDAKQRNAFYARQADILERLVVITRDRQQQTSWLKQLADHVGAAVQTGDFPEGVERLATLEEKLVRARAGAELIAYVTYRKLLAAYSQDMQDKDANFAKIQESWLGDLENFVSQHPQAEDAPEALLQLAMAQEFAGEEEKAKGWYGKIVESFPQSSQAKKAVGAKRRLDSVGQVLQLRGPGMKGGTVDVASWKGQLVLVQYWATWCEPCKQDMETLVDLVARYGRSGFAVVGVNVDQQPTTAAAFLQRTRIAWPQIHEPGGLDSRLATELGVLTLPTMLLLDQQGRVVHRNIHVSEVEAELKDRLKDRLETATPATRGRVQ
ncbi:MAG: redoxin family protein [Planctomycetales bacterium]|nr:redoxin family protein [Planctomycetales bacterium]